MKKNSGFSIALIVMVVLHAIMIIFALLYAFLGEYESNSPSNMWAAIGARGLLAAMPLGAVVFIIMGIMGLTTSKGNKRQTVLSCILLGSLLPGAMSFIIAVGSHM